MSKTTSAADYDKVISEAYLRLKNEYGQIDSYPFEKKLLEDVTSDLLAAGHIAPIKNIPDIKYTYDARKDFPPSISEDGFWAIIGRGKGKYNLQKIHQNNLIRIHKDFNLSEIPVHTINDQTPIEVASILGDDEQATMTRIRYNDILTHFLGVKAHQVQGHERTNLSCGQIEVDEIYVATDGKEKFIVPISGKGGDKDCLSYTQAWNLSVYSCEKSRYQGYTGRPLGILKDNSGLIYITEFTCSLKIQDIKVEKISAYRLIR